jgi:MGT family glycosyltransferase
MSPVRVAIVTTAERGHLNPMLGVAQWLVRRGHTVGWLGIPHAVSIPGVDSLRLGRVEAPPLVTGGQALARLVRDPPALRAWIRTLLLDAVPAQIDPVRRALATFGPDVVALDPMLYQAVIACEREAIPWAAVSSSLNPITPPSFDCDLVRTIDSLARDRDALFARHGLAFEFRVADCLSPRLTTVFATAAYAGDAPVPPSTRLVGPSLPPEGRADDPPDETWGSPLVYASFGSQISWQPVAYRTLAAAVAPLGATLVVSAGELPLADLPGRVVVRPWVPQLAILARADLFVTHGGANSVMEALAAGVPLLVSPVCNDQPIQAWFLERSGAGRRLDLHTATVEETRAAIARLLDSAAPERAAAARIADSYRAHDGAAEAARLIAELAAR